MTKVPETIIVQFMCQEKRCLDALAAEAIMLKEENSTPSEFRLLGGWTGAAAIPEGQYLCFQHASPLIIL